MLQSVGQAIVVVGFSREAEVSVDDGGLAASEDHGQAGQVGAVLDDGQNSVQIELHEIEMHIEKNSF